MKDDETGAWLGRLMAVLALMFIGIALGTLVYLVHSNYYNQ